MQIDFLIGNQIKYSARLNMNREELFPNHYQDLKQKFKIPINKNQIYNQKVYDDFEDEESESSYSSDSFDANDDEEPEGKIEIRPQEDYSFQEDPSKINLRKYKSQLSMEYYKLTGSTKKPKRELTEDEILKKNDQIMKRKLHAKKMLEEEKRLTIEKILNEDGKKLKDRQKKLNEEVIKKEQLEQEKYKASLTKIKQKYNKDGTIYLRFPEGLLLPRVITQKPTGFQSKIQKCEIPNCRNNKKYKDPVTGKFYCSVQCYNILKNMMHVS